MSFQLLKPEEGLVVYGEALRMDKVTISHIGTRDVLVIAPNTNPKRHVAVFDTFDVINATRGLKALGWPANRFGIFLRYIEKAPIGGDARRTFWRVEWMPVKVPLPHINLAMLETQEFYEELWRHAVGIHKS